MFSIVIPVYNAKASLERCVDSWLCQTRKDLEIILVDDGSSDGSKELCDRLAKNHSGTCVRVIHQANSGVSAARNAGIRAAEGEFLLFIWKRWQLCRKTVMQIWYSADIIISMMVQIL